MNPSRLWLLLLCFLLPAADPPPARFTLRPEARRQVMAGFGVNFNGTYYRESQRSAIQLLVDELGVSLVRFDPYGLSNWESINDNGQASVANWDYFRDRYSTPAFEASWAAAREFNRRGVRLILNMSGIAPGWMLDGEGGKPWPDGRKGPDHLRADMHQEYAETAVTMAAYARFTAKVSFDLFNPVNETDCPPREGPGVTPQEMPSLLAAVAARMRAEGLSDVKLVVPDQCNQEKDYFGPILARQELMPSVAALTLHSYGQEDIARQMAKVAASPTPNVPLWLTEYGDLNDLDFSAANEWKNFSLRATRRALDAIRAGASAALYWDAYDNFHEHDQRMTYYGLLSNRDHEYAPKKRFYAARQLFHFVRPGFQRIELEGAAPGYSVVAFRDARTLVIVGVKEGPGETALFLLPPGMAGRFRWELHQTTADQNGSLTDLPKPSEEGIAVLLPAESVFTLVGRERE